MRVPNPVPHLRISPEAQANHGGHPSHESYLKTLEASRSPVESEVRICSQSDGTNDQGDGKEYSRPQASVDCSLNTERGGVDT